MKKIYVLLFLFLLFIPAKAFAGAESGQEEAVFLYFYISPCDDCDKAKAIIDTAITQYNVNLQSLNIYDEDSLARYYYFSDKNNIEESRRQVPVLFYEGGYIDTFTEEAVLQAFQYESGVFLSEAQASEINGANYLTLIIMGFINGLNPCSMSMIFLLFSLLIVRKLPVLKLGLVFLIGKITAYFTVGLLIYTAASSINLQSFSLVNNVINLIMAALFLFLGVLSFLDFLSAKNERYDKIRLQLPTGLRKWNHSKIEALIEKSSGKYFLLSVFLLAFVISVGEFLCTGQVYLASILYILKVSPVLEIKTVMSFLIYVLSMAAPLFILIIFAHLGTKIFKLSETARKNMPWIKLLNMLIFFGFALFLLLN